MFMSSFFRLDWFEYFSFTHSSHSLAKELLMRLMSADPDSVRPSPSRPSVRASDASTLIPDREAQRASTIITVVLVASDQYVREITR